MPTYKLDTFFFGRTKNLELLKKRLSDLKEGYRQNLAVLADPYVGKSSLLKYFLGNIDDQDIICLYLNLENKDFPFFFYKMTTGLLYNYAKLYEHQPQEDLDLLCASLKDKIPQTVAVIKKIKTHLKARKYAAAYLGLLTLPDVFTNETSKFCVLILDEFQNLDSFKIPEAFVQLGQKIMTHKKCLYIVASSHPRLAHRILTEKLSLLFGNFETMILEPFDHQNCQRYVETYLGDYGMGAHLSNFLADFTGGYPLYLNLICQEMIHVSALHRQNEIYMPILIQAIENTLLRKWGVLSRHFDLLVQSLNNHHQYLPVLLCLANGRNKLEDMMVYLDLKKSPLNQRLKCLVEDGLIFKNGSLYYFKDKLFKYWLKYVYQKRISHVDLEPDHQRRAFKEELQKAIEQFKSTSRQDLGIRLQDLFTCFDNEFIDLNGRRVRLPAFQRIEYCTLPDENGFDIQGLRAKTKQGQWFIAFKRESFQEQDVSSILKKLKRYASRFDRILMVCLTELDDHTRLRALQERFWIWNEREINTLLTMFDKPSIYK